MKLLIITNNPDRASFRQRIGIYLDMLRAEGIKPELMKLPKGLLSRRKLFKHSAEFNGVFLHKKKLNFIDALLLRNYSKKIIYDFDDAIMYSNTNPQRFSRAHYVPFRRTVKITDLVIAGNAYLAEHARKYNPNVTILPTGLDTKSYRLPQHPINDGKIHLVWIGSRSTIKYLAEIAPALEEIARRFNNVVLRIIADEFIDLKNMPVEKCKWTRETETTDLAACDIGLAPLPDNRFTRGKCGFKILQYSAAGLAVVASPVGVNNEYIRRLNNGLIAEGISEWVDKISCLIADSMLRKQTGQNGITEVERFDLTIIGHQLVEQINNCIGKRT
jgi:glycosyltransferase involved in cell wall biosynthesis